MKDPLERCLDKWEELLLKKQVRQVLSSMKQKIINNE